MGLGFGEWFRRIVGFIDVAVMVSILVVVVVSPCAWTAFLSISIALLILSVLGFATRLGAPMWWRYIVASLSLVASSEASFLLACMDFSTAVDTNIAGIAPQPINDTVAQLGIWLRLSIYTNAMVALLALAQPKCRRREQVGEARGARA